MADTPTGETVTPEAPSNGPSTVAAPVVDNSNADVEAAKKEAEQARMRANQLENEKKALEERLAAEERKKLEEKEEFKTLAERLQAELDAKNAQEAETRRRAELTQATENVFKDYPANVVNLAKTAGLTLSDDSEAGVAAFKEKLDAFKAQVGTPAAAPNNPRPASTNDATKEQLLAGMRSGNKEAVSKYIQSIPAVQQWKEGAQKGLY